MATKGYYKYLYVILVECVNVDENDKIVDIIKFGVTFNYKRRFSEYNKYNIGKFKKCLHIFKTSKPKRLESILKWKLNGLHIRPYHRQEYYEFKYYDKIIEDIHKIVNFFNMDLTELRYEE